MATFTAHVDNQGRNVILCDDALAVSMLAFASTQGWREVPDMAYGYSQEYAPGTLVHTLALASWRAQEAAGIGYAGWMYATSAWDYEANKSRAGFIADREAGRVVTNLPSFGYCDSPETTPCRFAG